MVTGKDLVEDWIAMRATLSRQLALLKSGDMHAGGNVSEAIVKATIAQLEKWIGELNALLKDYARS